MGSGSINSKTERTRALQPPLLSAESEVCWADLAGPGAPGCGSERRAWLHRGPLGRAETMGIDGANLGAAAVR